SNYFLPLSSKVHAAALADARKEGAVLAYGNFFTLVINFVIIAWALFLVVRGINRLYAPQPAAPAGPSKEVQLLTEIRDLLKKGAWAGSAVRATGGGREAAAMRTRRRCGGR